MRLLLVATNREPSPFPVAPLGALCVAAAARGAGHEVRFLDLGLKSSPRRALEEALAAGDPQAVAFSIRNLDNCFVLAPRSYFGEVRELVEMARRTFQGPLILGGSGFSVAPHGWMQRLPADYGVVGEGERVFVELLAGLESGRPVEGLRGVVTRTADALSTDSEPTEPVRHLGELAPPAHELCGYPKYLRRGGAVSLQTKRGCPFSCAYCVYPRLEGTRYRLRPPEAVADEVEAVIRHSRSRHFFFVDSVFNDPREQALEVCRELTRRRVPMRWMAFCNPVGFDSELAHAMAQAGCEGLEFGMDAATPKMLAAMRKPFRQEEIRVAMRAAREAGLPFAVHLLFGGPGETWPDVEEAQHFLNDCAPANSIFASFGIRIYERTAMEEIAVREGLLTPKHDLFEPAYYISPALVERAEENLDRIARRRPEWTSPMDWRRPLMRYIQKTINFLGVRPQWKDIRGYGLHMRK
ncbi:MAG TPA: radical SAM protein [Verrucomicrobiae bacterium]